MLDRPTCPCIQLLPDPISQGGIHMGVQSHTGGNQTRRDYPETGVSLVFPLGNEEHGLTIGQFILT